MHLAFLNPIDNNQELNQLNEIPLTQIRFN